MLCCGLRENGELGTGTQNKDYSIFRAAKNPDKYSIHAPGLYGQENFTATSWIFWQRKYISSSVESAPWLLLGLMVKKEKREIRERGERNS